MCEEIASTTSWRAASLPSSTVARIVAANVASGTSEKSARYEIAAANCEPPRRAVAGERVEPEPVEVADAGE